MWCRKIYKFHLSWSDTNIISLPSCRCSFRLIQILCIPYGLVWRSRHQKLPIRPKTNIGLCYLYCTNLQNYIRIWFCFYGLRFSCKKTFFSKKGNTMFVCCLYAFPEITTIVYVIRRHDLNVDFMKYFNFSNISVLLGIMTRTIVYLFYRWVCKARKSATELITAIRYREKSVYVCLWLIFLQI